MSDNASWPVALYLIATAVLTIISVLLAAETYDRDIDSTTARPHGPTTPGA